MNNQISNTHEYSQLLEDDLSRAKASFAELLKQVHGPQFVIDRLCFLIESVAKRLPTNQESFVVMACCMKYSDYLKTSHWQKVRAKVLERYGDSCSFCCSDNQLQVHHRTYKRLGREEWGDVILLCRECHDLFHQHRHADGQFDSTVTSKCEEKTNDTQQNKVKRKKRNDIQATT